MIRLHLHSNRLHASFTRGPEVPEDLPSEDDDLAEMQANMDRIGEENLDAIAVDYAVNKGKSA